MIEEIDVIEVIEFIEKKVFYTLFIYKRNKIY